MVFAIYAVIGQNLLLNMTPKKYLHLKKMKQIQSYTQKTT